MCPFTSQDQLSTLSRRGDGFASVTSLLLASLKFVPFIGLIIQDAKKLSAAIFRDSVNTGWVFENETHSHDTILGMDGPR